MESLCPGMKNTFEFVFLRNELRQTGLLASLPLSLVKCACVCVCVIVAQILCLFTRQSTKLAEDSKASAHYYSTAVIVGTGSDNNAHFMEVRFRARLLFDSQKYINDVKSDTGYSLWRQLIA